MKVGHKCYVADVKWLHVTQDGVQWRDFVNRILNIRVPQKAVIIPRLPSQRRICFCTSLVSYELNTNWKRRHFYFN